MNYKIEQLSNGKYRLKKPDGTWFSYGAKMKLWGYYNSKTEFLGYQFPDYSTKIEIGNNIYILVERDGTLFTYKGITEFEYIYRFADSSTLVKVGNKYALKFQDNTWLEHSDIQWFDKVYAYDDNLIVVMQDGKCAIRNLDCTWLKYDNIEWFKSVARPRLDLIIVEYMINGCLHSGKISIQTDKNLIKVN